MMTVRALSTGSALIGAALLLTSCAASLPAVGPDSEAPRASAAPTPTTIATIAPEDATCENMLSDDTVAEFAETGWTVREDPFVILDLELPDGIACTWGDFSSPTNDDLILFGWSPITAEEAATVSDSLVAEGWIREEEGGAVVVTEDPELALRVDEQGYGMTYRFGDGWVSVSDTKQSLDLITLVGP